MENVQVGSMQQATLVVGVIALATDNDKGISDDSQVRKRCYSCKKILLQKIDLSPHSTSVFTNKRTRSKRGWGRQFQTSRVFLSTLTSTRFHCSLECGKSLLKLN